MFASLGKCFAILLIFAARCGGDAFFVILRGAADSPRGTTGQTMIATGFEAVAPEMSRVRALLLRYGTNVLIVAACTLVCLAVFPHLDLVSFTMVYVLGTVSIASVCSLPSALLACFLSVLAYNYFFVPPRFGIGMVEGEDLFTMAMMFVVVIVVSRLTEHFRTQARNASAREAQTRLMMELTRELASARGTDTLLDIATKQIERLFGFSAAAYLLDDAGLVLSRAGAAEDFRNLPDAEAAARWVLSNNQPAGLGTGHMRQNAALYLPMSGVGGTLGVLCVRPPRDATGFPPEQLHVIETLARQVGLMLEVERLEADRMRARMEIEAERLKTSLLSSVTHDLQTPLAVIIGSAESLMAVGEELTPEERRELSENIHDRAARLSRLLGNLLRMTRLQSGTLKPDFQLQPLDEPLGAALSLIGKELAARRVEVDIPPDLPLLMMDGVLMEQLFLNLLENTLKHTPPDSPVRIAAKRVGPEVEVEVADRGPGLDEAELEKVFSLFYQGSPSALQAGGRAGERKGYGLGLAICRAIAQVHGGTVRAEHRAGGGLVMRVTLPAPADALCLPTDGASCAEGVL